MSKTNTHNISILKAARGEVTDRIPVWIMRQAGRHLPEYRQVREKHSFLDICLTPRIASEVTLQPVKRYDLDAAIIFSDILVIPIAIGMEVDMIPGPVFKKPLTCPEDIKNLNFDRDTALGNLKYVFDAIRYTRNELKDHVPLIGFSGGPWTLLVYMIEGKSSVSMCAARSWLYAYPTETTELLQNLCDVIVEYMVGLVRAGAQLLQVFESHAGVLNSELFRKYSLPFLKQIATRVKSSLKSLGLYEAPMIVFAKDAHYAIEDLNETDYDVIGLDWTIDPSEARKKTNKCLQGNLDPCALYASPDEIRRLVKEMIAKFGAHNYIANLGHGIDKDVDPEKVKVFIDAVHEFSNIK